MRKWSWEEFCFIYHHIGGLEKFGHPMNQPHIIYHHIGGLEITGLMRGHAPLIYHHIGGLETRLGHW